MTIDDFQNIKLVYLHPLGLCEWWFVVYETLHLKKCYYQCLCQDCKFFGRVEALYALDF